MLLKKTLHPLSQKGAALIEVLIALIILSISAIAVEYFSSQALRLLQSRQQLFKATVEKVQCSISKRKTECALERENPIQIWNCPVDQHFTQKMVSYE